MLQAKWVTGIELLEEVPDWYSSKRGWSQTGVIRTRSVSMSSSPSGLARKA